MNALQLFPRVLIIANIFPQTISHGSSLDRKQGKSQVREKEKKITCVGADLKCARLLRTETLRAMVIEESERKGVESGSLHVRESNIFVKENVSQIFNNEKS